MRDSSEFVRDLIRATLAAVDPAEQLRRHWVAPQGPVTLLACGKASAAMLNAALRLLPDPPARAIATVPPEHMDRVNAPGVRVLPCDHPYPTARNVEAARAVLQAVQAARGQIILLLSGGASAHLALPQEPLTLDQLRAATVALLRAGATIRDVALVRKHVEQLKGGRLAGHARVPMLVYVLSDIVGDPLNLIGSGPACPDSSTPADALAAVEALGLSERLSEVVSFLRRSTSLAPAPAAAPVHHVIVGSHRDLAEALKARLLERGFEHVDMVLNVEGEAARVGDELARSVRALPPGHAVILAGEWTVTVNDATGTGGPSQEVALSAAKGIQGLEALVASFSSDGIDGPTHAAGGWADGNTWTSTPQADALLARHDSTTALTNAGTLIQTGPTGTNINHAAFALRWPS